jgi:hypothetical protein
VHLLADVGITSGHNTLADLLFLIAAIVFGVAAVLRLMAHAVDGFLVAAALGLVALAWFVL